MKLQQLRNWLGLYFLLLTTILGAYILLFSESMFLPISKSDGVASFEIIIPVLMGQLTIIFRWFGADFNVGKNSKTGLPPWIVKGPPIIVASVLGVTIGVMVIGNMSPDLNFGIGSDTFKAIVTFCVSILNATTIFIVSRFFQNKKERSPGKTELASTEA
jgi:hypothetical protein